MKRRKDAEGWREKKWIGSGEEGEGEVKRSEIKKYRRIRRKGRQKEGVGE